MDNLYTSTFEHGDFREGIYDIRLRAELEDFGIIKTVNEINAFLEASGVKMKVWEFMTKEFWMLRWKTKHDRVFGVLSHMSEMWTSHRYIHQVVTNNPETDIGWCPLCGRGFELKIGHYHELAQSVFGVPVNTPICTSCAQGIYMCDSCEEVFTDGRGYYVGDSTIYCESCWKEAIAQNEIELCVQCGGYSKPEDMLNHNGSKICEYCWDERAYECMDCGRIMFDRIDQMRWVDDEVYCSNCYNAVAVVAAYDHFIPDPPMLMLSGEKRRPDTLFFGCEFEIEMDWKKNYENGYTENQLGKIMADAVPPGVEWGYVKHDGSMKCGVEFVTHPMTEGFYKNNRKVIDQMFTNWKEVGFRTDQWDDEEDRYNCSLHVHMSKAAFTSAHLYKFVRFFYKIPMRRLVQAISQRAENEFAQWARDDFKFAAKLAKEKKNMSGNRYSVINLIGGHWHEHHMADSKTVEFRLFQGSMEPKIIHKNIEFLLSVFYFTRDTSITHITQKNYFKYLRAYRNRYRNLVNFLNDELRKGV